MDSAAQNLKRSICIFGEPVRIHDELEEQIYGKTTASYPDVSLSMKMCAQRKAGRSHYQSLAFRARSHDEKNEAPEEEAGKTMKHNENTNNNNEGANDLAPGM